MVDDCDYGELSKYRWGYHKSGGYASRVINLGNRKQRTILMHRQILSVPVGVSTDHINGNGRDNQRHNLRQCSHADNLKNQKLHANNTSGIRGVDYVKSHKLWRVRIQSNGKSFSIGRFPTLEEAGDAYRFASLMLHGEFGRPVRA